MLGSQMKMGRALKERLGPVRDKEELCDGIYIRGMVEGKEIWFSVDTGASRTVLSSQVFRSLDQGPSIPVKGLACQSEAGSDRLCEMGKGNVTLQLGPVAVEREVIVADIEDECLLGLDVLQNESGGPADLLLSRGVMRLNDNDIKVTQVGLTEAARKVTAQENSINGVSEAVEQVHVHVGTVLDEKCDSFYFKSETEELQEAYCPQIHALYKRIDLTEKTTNAIPILVAVQSHMATHQDVNSVQAEDEGQAVSAEGCKTRLTKGGATVKITEHEEHKQGNDKVDQWAYERKPLSCPIYDKFTRECPDTNTNCSGTHIPTLPSRHVHQTCHETAKKEVEDMRTICKRLDAWEKRRQNEDQQEQHLLQDCTRVGETEECKAINQSPKSVVMDQK